MTTPTTGDTITAAMLPGMGFRARRTGALSVPHAAYTNLTCDTEDSDTESMSSGSVATIPAAGGGWWTMFAAFAFSSSGMGSTVIQRITSSRYGALDFVDYAGTGDVIFNLAPVWCEAGDTFQLFLYQTSGASRSCTSGYWQMLRIAA
jgi:hypothetical protein